MYHCCWLLWSSLVTIGSVVMAGVVLWSLLFLWFCGHCRLYSGSNGHCWLWCHFMALVLMWLVLGWYWNMSDIVGAGYVL
jgi:hypothetical protein